jgi:D-aspartate ligase
VQRVYRIVDRCYVVYEPVMAFGTLPALMASDIDTTTPIVIFGLSRGGFHHGALGIARSAGRLGIPVYRVCRERSAPAARSRYNRGWISTPESATADQTLETLRDLSKHVGRPLLVPVDDAGSVFVDEHAGELADDFIFPRQPDGLASRLSSKRGMYELCRQRGIPTPLSVFPKSDKDVVEYTERATFPAVIKCINAADAPPGSPRVAIAQDGDELLDAWRLMGSSRVQNVMLQEYIPGTPEAVWMFNGYFDDHSECKVGFTGKKIRQSPPYTGVTTLGVCLFNSIVQETTVRLMKDIGYKGILDIGYRFDRRDDRYKLLDVNPRIGGTFRLFVGADGMDVLRAMYLDLTGQQVPASSLREGRRWVVDPTDLASSIVYRRRGDLTLGGWLRSFRGVREAAWFAVDDPLPFFALWVKLLIDHIPRRVLRHLRRRRTRGSRARSLRVS